MQVRRRTPMYISDWIETLDGFLKLSKHEILTHTWTISAKTAELKALEYMKKKLLGEGNKNKFVLQQ